jgi:CRP/FNR family transcriptional regulator
MENYPIECQDCFLKTSSCKPLSACDFNNLLILTEQRKFRKGDVIFKQGEKTEYLVFLTKGMVKLVYHNNGKDLILNIEKEQALLGLSNILNEDINISSIVAIDDCKGYIIDINTFKDMIVRNGQFILEVIGISTRMFRRSIFNFISIAHKQSNGRVADILIFLAETIYQNHSFRLTLSRQELAEFAGCSKELITRTLQSFGNEGIIRISGKKVEILDMEQLYKISKIG